MTASLAFVLMVSAVPASDGWTVLFNGRSTEAWRGYGRSSFPPGCWTVAGGALKTVPSKGKACDIITRHKYRDFELTLEYKVGTGGNSGILYRAAELPPPAPIWHSAPELQILDDGAHSTVPPQNLTGSLYDLVPAVDKIVRPIGEWNEARVVVRGPHVEHWLNGRKVLEYELGSEAFLARIASSKFKDMPRFAQEKEGHVGLQHHGEEAWFRNIRIRALSGEAQAAAPQLPPPFHSEAVRNAPEVIAQPEGARLTVPAGFKVEVVADGFQKPRFMLLGPSNEVLLSDSAQDGKGAVYVLRDADGDGKLEQKARILEGLNRPYGLALWKGYLYVGEPDSLKRYRYDAKAMKAATPGEEVVALPDFGKGHWTRTVLFDPKGEKLYLTIGSNSNVDAGEDPRRAAINRYNPDGTGHEIFASGLRNVIGLRFEPRTGTLWAATQERDNLGDDLVPDYFTSVKQGAFYGWPYAYIGPHEDPRRKGEKPELVKATVVPDVLLGSHVAVLDALFYTGKSFPREYRGGAFLAQHGSWNRAQRVGYNVVFLPFKDGKPAGKPVEFLSGFMVDPSKKEVWGRPVGLLELADGSLLMTDDGGNKVWRISYGKR